MSDDQLSGLRPETLAAQALHYSDTETRAVVPPIHPATTYLRGPGYAPPPVTGYGRDHNPTAGPAEATLARLEGAADCLLFASGLAASAAVLASLKPGDHVVAQAAMYWGFRAHLQDFCATWGLGLDLVDTTDLDAVRDALRPGETRLVWAEAPGNPLWQVPDIAALAELAHGAGARLAIDSTAATPVLTRPLALGADLVMHSATKYLNGHSDVLAGALCCAAQDELWQRIRGHRSHGGAVLGAFEAWLLLRGLRTLYVRVGRASESALAIARHFDGHPKIRQVLYPGLPGHSDHAVAVRQMQGGFGGMLSLCVTDGEAAAIAAATRCRVFLPATSLGGVESLIEHRPTVEGPDSPIPRDLLRLSVGLEHVDDLIADLEQALAG